MAKVVSEKQKQRIWAAADELHRNGQPTSNEDVRLQLGGGSMSDISPAMAEWRDNQNQRNVKEVEIPDSIVAVFRKTMMDVWQTADELMEEKIDSHKNAIEKKLKESNVERESLLREIQNLENQVNDRDEMQQELANARGEIKSLTKDVKNAEASKEAAIAKSDQKDETIAKLNERINDLLSEAADTAGQIGELQGELNALKNTNKEAGQ